MDPNTAMSEISRRLEALMHGPVESHDQWLDDWFELVEHVEGLNEWLMKGGFLPRHIRDVAAWK